MDKNTIYKMSQEEIKEWLSDNKVLFVTNTLACPGSTFVSSMRTYIDYLPIHNFSIIPGEYGGKPHYGLNAFMNLINVCLSDTVYKHFDYVIYIDDDCFITDFNALVSEFYEFMKDDAYVIGGPQDGGMFCHRNHQAIMINTFVSFWNMKVIREKTTSVRIKTIVNTLTKNGTDMAFKTFVSMMNSSIENKKLLEDMMSMSNKNLSLCIEYRHNYFKNGETPYSQVVKDDPENPSEPHQDPYSNSYGREWTNFEPYYYLEQALVIATSLPIYYMFGSDSHNVMLDEDDDSCDNSGLTSVLLTREEFKPYCYHTWFSRGYSRWPSNKLMLKHTNRINKEIIAHGCI